MLEKYLWEKYEIDKRVRMESAHVLNKEANFGHLDMTINESSNVMP